jgi:membrane-associated phospholipid phosphatase
MSFWKSEFRKNSFKVELAVTIILLIITLHLLSRFLLFVEGREGVIMQDPILPLFTAVDLTWFAFALIYLSIFTAIIVFIPVPRQIMLTIQSYIIMVGIRITAMYLTPLDPPPGMIPLNDPVVEIFGTGQLLTRDLFFSGHTATLFLFYLVSDKKILRYFFLICSLLVGISVILQKVHYTIDVFVAPFFAYIAFRIACEIRRNILHNS